MGDATDPMESIGSIIDRMMGKGLGAYMGGAERRMVANALRHMADRVLLGQTRSFDLKWEEGGTLEGSEVVIPSEPIKFIHVKTVLEGEDGPGRPE